MFFFKVFFWGGEESWVTMCVRYQGGGAIASAWHQAFEYAIYTVLLLFTVLLCSNGLIPLLTVLVVPSMKFQREHIVESQVLDILLDPKIDADRMS